MMRVRRLALCLGLALPCAAAAQDAGAEAPAADAGLSTLCGPGTRREERAVALPQGPFLEVRCLRGEQLERRLLVDAWARVLRLEDLDADAGVRREYELYPNGQLRSLHVVTLATSATRDELFWPDGCRLAKTSWDPPADGGPPAAHGTYFERDGCERPLAAGPRLLTLEPAVSQSHRVTAPARVAHARGGSITLSADDGGVACVGGTSVCLSLEAAPARWRVDWSAGARWAAVGAEDGSSRGTVFDVQRRSQRRLDGTFVAPARLRLAGDAGVLDLGAGTKVPEPCGEPGSELRPLGAGGWLCVSPQRGEVLEVTQVRGEARLRCELRVSALLADPFLRGWAVRGVLTPGEPCAALVKAIAPVMPAPLEW